MDKISSDSDNNSPDSDSFIWCSGGDDSPIDGMKDHQKLKGQDNSAEYRLMTDDQLETHLFDEHRQLRDIQQLYSVV